MSTERKWPSPAEVAEQLRTRLEAAHPTVFGRVGYLGQRLQTALTEWNGEMFVMEKKLSRLYEKWKDAVGRGVYGPLAEGGKLTPLGEAYADLQAMHTVDVLNAVDEEGNLIEED